MPRSTALDVSLIPPVPARRDDMVNLPSKTVPLWMHARDMHWHLFDTDDKYHARVISMTPDQAVERRSTKDDDVVAAITLRDYAGTLDGPSAAIVANASTPELRRAISHNMGPYKKSRRKAETKLLMQRAPQDENGA